MKQFDRIENLDDIFTQIKKICVDKDLRFGQLMEVIRSKVDADDLFYVGNKSILEWLENYSLTK